MNLGFQKITRKAIAVGMVYLVAALVACGGTPHANETQEIALQIVLPNGNFAPTTLETAYASNTVSGLGVKAEVPSQSPTLATLNDAKGRLLMAFVSPIQTKISTRTTAEVFAFYALGGPFLEPAMQGALLGFLQNSTALAPVVTAVEAAIAATPRHLAADQTNIKNALATLRATLGSSSDVQTQSVGVSPANQSSGVLVRETTPLADAANVYNSFHRDVFVLVERISPQPGLVASFVLPGAFIETPAAAQSLQNMIGFAQGDVPRNATKSQDIPLPALENSATTYTITVLGAGGNALPAGTNAEKSAQARNLAMRTAIEKFLLPSLQSLLETGAKERSVADIAPILQGISAATKEKIETGDFTQGVRDAFQDLFGPQNLSSTIDRVLPLYYPGIQSRDGLANMKERLTRNLAGLVTASAESASNNGVANTIRNSKRLEVFTVVTKPITMRLTPEQSFLGKGGTTTLSAELKLAPGENTNGLTYRWTLAGVGAGFARDGTTEKVFGFETSNNTVTYKHRDTINVLYGVDTITVEALRNTNGTPAVIAKASAVVTTKASTIYLTPDKSNLRFGDVQTFTATVAPRPSKGTLYYTFTTFGGSSTFVGGAQTSVGALESVRYRESRNVVGAKQTVEVDVVLDVDGVSTVLGEAKAVVTLVQSAPPPGPTPPPPPCASCIP